MYLASSCKNLGSFSGLLLLAIRARKSQKSFCFVKSGLQAADGHRPREQSSTLESASSASTSSAALVVTDGSTSEATSVTSTSKTMEGKSPVGSDVAWPGKNGVGDPLGDVSSEGN